MNPLSKAKRPKYDTAAAVVGQEAEYVIHKYLCGQDIPHDWNNMKIQGYDIDFVIYDLYRPNRGLEIERKDAKFEDLAMTSGFDFLAAKVHKYIMVAGKVSYGLVMSHYRHMYVADVVDIMLFGDPIWKNTTRMKDEWFYRMPMRRLNKVYL